MAVERVRERVRERERNAYQVMYDSMMSNPRRFLRHAQCLFSYFLIYLTMWLKQLFKWKGENLTNLHILWKFCVCNIVLACYGLQKWQNRFGVDCKSSHSSNSGGFLFYIDRNELDLTTDNVLPEHDKANMVDFVYSLRECLSTHDNPSVESKTSISLKPVNLKPFYINLYLNLNLNI